MLKEAQGHHIERAYGEWGAWPSSQESAGSPASSGPGYWVSEMSHSPSATPGPCPKCRFLRHPLCQEKKKIALVLRYHLLGFSYRVVRANWASRANPPQSKPLRIVNFIVWFLPLEVVSLFHGNAEYLQKPKGFSFPKTLRLMDFDASTLLFIHLYSLYGFPFGSGD